MFADDGGVVGANIDGSKRVCELKQLLAHRGGLTCPLNEVKLFLAKSSDGKWLREVDPDASICSAEGNCLPNSQH